MVHTVGLLGHNGFVGKALLHALLPAAQAGKIKLVVLHRPESDISTVPEGIEAREVDLDTGDVAKNSAALAGIHFPISTVGSAGLQSQLHLIPALKTSKDLISFVPSHFGFNWKASDIVNPQVSFLTAKDTIADKLHEAGIPLTTVLNGGYTEFVFKGPPVLFGVDAQGNSLDIPAEAYHAELPILPIAYLAAGVAEVLVSDPQSLPNSSIYLYERLITGDDVAKAFTAVHGKPATVKVYTEEDFAKDISGMPQAVGATFRRKWASGWFGFEHARKVEPTGWVVPPLEEVVRGYIPVPS